MKVDFLRENIVVSKENDKKKLLSFLKKEEIWAGYAICDIEEDMFQKCEWYVSKSNGDIISLCLYFKGFEPATQISIGETTGIEKILEKVNKKKLYIHMPLTHRKVMERHYSFEDLKLMSRMFVSRKTFKSVKGSATRIHKKDLSDLERLYSSREGTFFRPYMLSGVYYGMREDGEIISVAGTHVVSSTYGIACIGNVFTTPLHRNKGYASICTSEVAGELLNNCENVILNVDVDNYPAIKVYNKLGFKEYCKYLEGLGHLL